MIYVLWKAPRFVLLRIRGRSSSQDEGQHRRTARSRVSWDCRPVKPREDERSEPAGQRENRAGRVIAAGIVGTVWQKEAE